MLVAQGEKKRRWWWQTYCGNRSFRYSLSSLDPAPQAMPCIIAACHAGMRSASLCMCWVSSAALRSACSASYSYSRSWAKWCAACKLAEPLSPLLPPCRLLPHNCHLPHTAHARHKQGLGQEKTMYTGPRESGRGSALETVGSQGGLSSGNRRAVRDSSCRRQPTRAQLQAGWEPPHSEVCSVP